MKYCAQSTVHSVLPIAQSVAVSLTYCLVQECSIFWGWLLAARQVLWLTAECEAVDGVLTDGMCYDMFRRCRSWTWSRHLRMEKHNRGSRTGILLNMWIILIILIPTNYLKFNTHNRRILISLFQDIRQHAPLRISSAGTWNKNKTVSRHCPELLFRSVKSRYMVLW